MSAVPSRVCSNSREDNLTKRVGVEMPIYNAFAEIARFEVCLLLRCEWAVGLGWLGTDGSQVITSNLELTQNTSVSAGVALGVRKQGHTLVWPSSKSMMGTSSMPAASLTALVTSGLCHAEQVKGATYQGLHELKNFLWLKWRRMLTSLLYSRA